MPQSLYATHEQEPLSLQNAGLAVGDPDSGSDVETATLSVSQGLLTATAGSTDLNIQGSGTSRITLTGSISSINSVLQGGADATLTYASPTPTASPTSLTLTISDNTDSVSGSATATGTISNSITAPVLTLTASGGRTFNANQSISGTFLTPNDEDDEAYYTAGASVLIRDNGTSIGSAVVGTDGTWSTSITLPFQGVNVLTATAEDRAGNQTATTGAGFTLRTLTTIEQNVELLYESVLGRPADDSGLDSYAGVVDAGGTLSDVAASLIGSAEFSSDYGALDNTQFVIALLQNTYPLLSYLDRPDFQVLVAALNAGASRANVAVDLAVSDEAAYQAAALDDVPLGGVIDPTVTGSMTHDPTSAAGQVMLLYDTLTGAPPSALGLETATAAFLGGSSIDQIASQILSTEPYQAQDAALSDREFLSLLYENSFGRTPDADGSSFYLAELGAGVSRSAIASDIALSSEHISDMQPAFASGVYVPDNAGSAVARLYYAALGRAPDLLGLESYETALHNGVPLDQLASSLFTSDEYERTHGVPTNEQFVSMLYQNALGRAPDNGGQSFYLNELHNGTSRGTVAAMVAESSEAQLHLAPTIEGAFRFA